MNILAKLFPQKGKSIFYATLYGTVAYLILQSLFQNTASTTLAELAAGIGIGITFVQFSIIKFFKQKRNE